MPSFLLLLFVLFTQVASTQPAHAQTPTPVRLYCNNNPLGEGGCGDTYLSSGFSDQNYGNKDEVFIRDIRHMLVKFSVAEMQAAAPAGFSVGSAKLRLFINSGSVSNWPVGGGFMDIHRVLTPWLEGKGPSGGIPGVTWACPIDTNVGNSQPNCTTQWGGGTITGCAPTPVPVTGSCDYIPTATASVLHTNAMPTSVYLEYDVSADVAYLLANPSMNNGWLIKKQVEGPGFDVGRIKYATREDVNPAHRPELALFVAANTPTPLPTNTVPTATPTDTATATATETATGTETATFTFTNTPPVPFTSTETGTPSATPTPTNTPTGCAVVQFRLYQCCDNQEGTTGCNSTVCASDAPCIGVGKVCAGAAFANSEFSIAGINAAYPPPSGVITVSTLLIGARTFFGGNYTVGVSLPTWATGVVLPDNAEILTAQVVLYNTGVVQNANSLDLTGEWYNSPNYSLADYTSTSSSTAFTRPLSLLGGGAQNASAIQLTALSNISTTANTSIRLHISNRPADAAPTGQNEVRFGDAGVVNGAQLDLCYVTPTPTITVTYTPTATSSPSPLPTFTPRPGQIGDVTRVDGGLPIERLRPALSTARGGGLLWTNYFAWASRPQDGSQLGIFGRHTDDALTPVGAEFQINTYTTLDQTNPRVSSAPNNISVAVWDSTVGGVTISDIIGRRYTSGGGFAAEFQVNTYTTGYQQSPRVDANASGAFAVVWANDPNASPQMARARAFLSTGTATGNDFQVNFTNPGPPSYFDMVDVATKANGDFVVVWSGGNDGQYTGVFAKAFASSGAAIGSEFQINTGTIGKQEYPIIVGNEGNTFVVAWQSYPPVNDEEIKARRLVWTGSSPAPLGSEFRVDSSTGGYVFRPEACIQSSGDFVIVWDQGLIDGSDFAVWAQRFDASAAPVGSDFAINSNRTGRQMLGELSCDGGTRYTAVYQSDYTPLSPTDTAIDAIVFDFPLPTPIPSGGGDAEECNGCGCNF